MLSDVPIGNKENIVYIIIKTCIRRDDACRSTVFIGFGIKTRCPYVVFYKLFGTNKEHEMFGCYRHFGYFRAVIIDT